MDQPKIVFTGNPLRAFYRNEKGESAPFKKKEDEEKIIYLFDTHAQNGKVFDIPTGVEIKTEGSNSCRYSKCDCASYDKCFDLKAYLIE